MRQPTLFDDTELLPLFAGTAAHAEEPPPFESVKAPCKHPPTRLYSWLADDVLCVGCCDCGAILLGGC